MCRRLTYFSRKFDESDEDENEVPKNRYMITKQEARLLFLADSDIKRICFRIQRSQELQRNQDLFSEANMRTPFDLFFFTAFESSAEILGL